MWRHRSRIIGNAKSCIIVPEHRAHAYKDFRTRAGYLVCTDGIEVLYAYTVECKFTMKNVIAPNNITIFLYLINWLSISMFLNFYTGRWGRVCRSESAELARCGPRRIFLYFYISMYCNYISIFLQLIHYFYTVPALPKVGNSNLTDFDFSNSNFNLTPRLRLRPRLL